MQRRGLWVLAVVALSACASDDDESGAASTTVTANDSTTVPPAVVGTTPAEDCESTPPTQRELDSLVGMTLTQAEAATGQCFLEVEGLDGCRVYRPLSTTRAGLVVEDGHITIAHRYGDNDVVAVGCP